MPAIKKSLNDYRSLYNRVWRWHFFAGLYVIPFFLILASTGMMMVFTHLNESKFGENLYLDNIDHYTALSQNISAQAQLNSAIAAFPEAVPSQYIPSFQENRVALIQMDIKDATLLVSVNPYTNEVIGSLNKNETLYYWMNAIHGSLLMGEVGDLLLELAASLGILMLLTGWYLWFPHEQSVLSALNPFSFIQEKHKREFIKSLHSKIAVYISVALLFFLISGLSWTSIWGGKLVQAWSTFPAEKAAPAGFDAGGGHHGAVSENDKTETNKQLEQNNLENHESLNHTSQNLASQNHASQNHALQNHASLNHGLMKEVPWGLEQSPMPQSKVQHEHHHAEKISLDSVMQRAHDLGFTAKFRINLPKNEQGVYTLSATSMNGDITYPSEERTVHLDQYTGKVLADVNFADYSLPAKSMAVGIALHQGEFGLLNALVNIIFCALVIVLCLSGFLMWWLRRPSANTLLAAPIKDENYTLPLPLIFTAGLLAVLFPLMGLALLVIVIVDFMLGKLFSLK